jgi:MoaA/NifB/PqqE/SkfB family radical SAM enzyme
MARFEDPDALTGKCGACPYRSICGGSRARAYAVEGDWLASDPSCSYVPPGYRECPRASRRRLQLVE